MNESRRASFELVRLPNGVQAVYSSAYDEKMHPGLGPAAEADLYVRQLKLPERMRKTDDEFVVWDIGLGAAANAIAVLRATHEISRPLRMVSFDNTREPLAFALENASALGYLHGYEEQVQTLLAQREAQFANNRSSVTWQFQLEDFPSWLERRSRTRLDREAFQGADPEHGAPCPHAILFDAFSPARNPAMWTLPLFTNLFRTLDPQRPCNLTTYSRSTMFRVTLLLAGFFVGRGPATGLKEETTVAANDLRLVEQPLDARWLDRARRSDSAEPLKDPTYRRAPLNGDSWEQLRSQAQFA